MNREIFHEMALKAKNGMPIVNVCLLEIESLRQQLADSQKQVVILRDALAVVVDKPKSYEAVRVATQALAATEPK